MSRFERARSVEFAFGVSRLKVRRHSCGEYTRPSKTSKVTNEGVICAMLALAQAGRGVWYRNAAACKAGQIWVVTLLAAALRLDSLTIHLRANGSRFSSRARLRSLDCLLFGDPAFFSSARQQCARLYNIQRPGLINKQPTWTPSQSTAADGLRPSTTMRHGRGGGAQCTVARPTTASMWDDVPCWWCHMSDVL